MGERVMVYETTEEGWAWGQLETDGYVGWLSANALGAPGAAPTHKVTVPRTLAFPGPDIKLPPVTALPMGAAAGHRAAGRALRRHRRWLASSGGASGAAQGAAAGFRRGRRRIPARALSVGRQDLARHGLLGAGAGFAAGRGHRLPARQRHAGNGARQVVVARRICGAATWCSGKAMWPSPATARTCCTPMRITWRWRSSRRQEAIARIKAAGSDVTSVKRL